jgi:hypothetical protein
MPLAAGQTESCAARGERVAIKEDPPFSAVWKGLDSITQEVLGFYVYVAVHSNDCGQ